MLLQKATYKKEKSVNKEVNKKRMLLQKATYKKEKSVNKEISLY